MIWGTKNRPTRRTWFAWYPVRLAEGGWAWFENVIEFYSCDGFVHKPIKD